MSTYGDFPGKGDKVMELDIWNKWFERISKDLDLNIEDDREGALILSKLLGDSHCPPGEIAPFFQDKEVVIFGPAGSSGKAYEGMTIISAGSPSKELMARGFVPHLLVTDLDGDVEAQLECNRKGAVAVIHAHGDNVDALKKWVPEFSMPRIGTTQVEPLPNVYNFGGFTDGDRAVVIAAHFGAKRILLEGFDFDSPVRKDGSDSNRKRRKLSYSKQIIEYISETIVVEFVMKASR